MLGGEIAREDKQWTLAAVLRESPMRTRFFYIGWDVNGTHASAEEGRSLPPIAIRRHLVQTVCDSIGMSLIIMLSY